MKAALLVAPGRIVVDDIPEPPTGPGEVAIAVGGVGLCGSDASVFSGAWPTPTSPWVMGHEAFGTISAVGDGVPRERVGETVVVEPNVPCLACDPCRGGWTSACVSRTSVGMNRPGALAERLVVPAPFARAIDGVEARDLVCVEPLTVVQAALRRLGDVPASALVVGVGSQGLLMALALLERGVEVVASDVNAARVSFAESLGARRLNTDGDEGFELVVDSVGTTGSTDVAFAHLAVGGTLLILGLASQPLELTAQSIVRRQAIIRGSLTYDHPGDFASSVDLVREGRIRPGRIVTNEFSLDDTQRAFETSGSAVGKTWIRVAW